MVTLDGNPWFAKKDLIDKNYDYKTSILLYMPHTGRKKIIGIWIPKKN